MMIMGVDQGAREQRNTFLKTLRYGSSQHFECGHRLTASATEGD